MLPFYIKRFGQATTQRGSGLSVAFFGFNPNLLAACRAQLIRQITRESKGGAADCYAFGVRTMQGWRDDAQRVDAIRLHIVGRRQGEEIAKFNDRRARAGGGFSIVWWRCLPSMVGQQAFVDPKR